MVTAATEHSADDATAAPVAVTTSLVVPTAVPAAPPAPSPTLLTLLFGFFSDMQRTFFNRAPDARNQRVTIALGKPDDVSDPFALLARDRDGDTLAFSMLSNRGPRHGTVVFDQATGTFTYNPDDAFARTGGTDTFTYKVSDASSDWHLPGLWSLLTKPDFGHADIATVTITVAPTQPKSGIDFGDIDTSIRPQDDFFGWLHGKWLAEYEIPSDRTSDGVSRTVRDQISRQIRALVDELSRSGAAHGTDAQRIGDMFASFMDTATVARVGLQPVLNELARIDGAADADALAAVLGALRGVTTGFESEVVVDPKNSSRYVLGFGQSGLGLPSEAYYRDPKYADILAAYPEHIAKMFALVGGGTAADYMQTAQRIVALESKLAGAHWDAVKNRDIDLTYNLRAFADLAHEAPGFDWDGWLAAYGVAPEQVTEILVMQPDYLTFFAATWASEPLQDWKDWARWKLIHDRNFLLTDDLVAENFAFYSQKLTGAQAPVERWQAALNIVEDTLGYAVGQLWVERHFSSDAKNQIEALVGNLIEAYRDSIANLEWMSPTTRAKAIEKLDKLTVKVGYPEKWKDYSSLDVQRDDLYGNYLRSTELDFADMLAKLGQPVDRSEWGMTPQTVNAYYEPTLNEIVFPAGMLQGVYFNPGVDAAANYGAIGAVIGHEIGHAFDDSGSRYDGDGNIVEWWTAEDRAAFESRTRALVAQFDQYSPRQLGDDAYVSGAFTLGENIADLGGLAIALQAYQKSLQGKDAPVIDGYTGVQRVLLGYAQAWKFKARDAEALNRLATDPHSPPEFRVNGILRNLDAFYDAFGVDESSPLWVAPEDRVRIWY